MTAWNITLTDQDNQTALIDYDDFQRSIVQTALQEFLEAEMTEHIGANPYERSDDRTGLRNGYKARVLNLKVGQVYLDIPQARDGSFHTELFSRYQRSERAFTLAIIEMWLKGVSTRKVWQITHALSSITFSKSTVSELCKSLDEHVAAWKTKDLSAHTYPYLFVDALYEDIRVGGRVVSEGILIAAAIRDDGKREIVDVAVADTESAASYNDLFSSLKERGLGGVILVTSDAHAGLKSAIKRYFHGASWQRCQIHFMRDIAKKISLKHRSELMDDLSSIFEIDKRGQAMTQASALADKWRSKAPRVALMLDEDIEQCLSALAFPEDHRKAIRTNNFMERINKEIRRRDKVIEIFPNEASALRLISALCIEYSEQWIAEKPYLDMSLLNVDDEDYEAKLIYLELIKNRKVS
jgi:Transposase and inactivated derivatives